MRLRKALRFLGTLLFVSIVLIVGLSLLPQSGLQMIPVTEATGQGQGPFTLTTGVSGKGSVDVSYDGQGVKCDCFDLPEQGDHPDNVFSIPGAEEVEITANGSHCTGHGGGATEYGFYTWNSDISELVQHPKVDHHTFLMDADCYATAIFIRPEITVSDSDSVENGGTVAEAEELSRGAYALANTDDDDNDNDNDNIPDYEDEYVSGEDDLIPFTIGAPSGTDPNDDDVFLEIIDPREEEPHSPPTLQVWRHATKSADENGGGLETARQFDLSELPLTLYLEAPDASDSKHAEQIGVKYKGRDAVNLTFIEFAVNTSLERIQDADAEYRYTFLSHDPGDNRVDPDENIVNCTASVSPNDLDPAYSWSYEATLLHLQDPQGATDEAAIHLYAEADTAAPDGRTGDLNDTITVDVELEDVTLEGELEIYQTDVDYVRQTYVDVTHNQVAWSGIPERNAFILEEAFDNLDTPYLSWAGFNCNGGGFCNNHEHQINNTVIGKYEEISDEYGDAIYITSIYSCARWNKHEHGQVNSHHSLGEAFDGDESSSTSNWAIAVAANSGDPPEIPGPAIPAANILLYPVWEENYTPDCDYRSKAWFDAGPYTGANLPPGWQEIRFVHVTTGTG